MKRVSLSVLALSAFALLVGCSEADPSPGQGGSSAGGATNTGGSDGGAAAGGSAQGGGGQGGDGTGGTPGCNATSDPFGDASSRDCWSLLHEEEATPALHELLDIDGTVPDHLVIEPLASGWFQDAHGPFLFKEVAGSFVVEVHAAAVDENDANVPPTGDYHSAGLLVRDAASVTGSENWIMYNVGYQGDQSATTGTEGKTTVDSMSTLTIHQGVHSGLLRLCRLGDDFYLLKWLDDETAWTEEHHFVRPDLPDSLQLGLHVNAWPPGNASEPRNVQARFRDFRFGSAPDLAACTGPIEPQ